MYTHAEQCTQPTFLHVNGKSAAPPDNPDEAKEENGLMHLVGARWTTFIGQLNFFLGETNQVDVLVATQSFHQSTCA